MRNFCGYVLGALENHTQIGSMCSRKLQHRYCKKCIFPRGRGGIGIENYEMIRGRALALCTGEQSGAGDQTQLVEGMAQPKMHLVRWHHCIKQERDGVENSSSGQFLVH